MKMLSCVAGIAIAVTWFSAHAQSESGAPRFKALTYDSMSEVQKKAANDLASGQRGRLNIDGPNALLLRSPELMSRTQRVGEYLRYNSAIPPRLSELAILVTARQWTAQIEWMTHAPIAQKAGIDAAVIEDIAAGRRPTGMKDDEAMIYAFCRQLQETKTVDDATFKAVLDKFGENGVIDLVGITGYYTMLAMVLNVARMPLPAGKSPPLQALR